MSAGVLPPILPASERTSEWASNNLGPFDGQEGWKNHSCHMPDVLKDICAPIEARPATGKKIKNSTKKEIDASSKSKRAKGSKLATGPRNIQEHSEQSEDSGVDTLYSSDYENEESNHTSTVHLRTGCETTRALHVSILSNTVTRTKATGGCGDNGSGQNGKARGYHGQSSASSLGGPVGSKGDTGNRPEKRKRPDGGRRRGNHAPDAEEPANLGSPCPFYMEDPDDVRYKKGQKDYLCQTHTFGKISEHNLRKHPPRYCSRCQTYIIDTRKAELAHDKSGCSKERLEVKKEDKLGRTMNWKQAACRDLGDENLSSYPVAEHYSQIRAAQCAAEKAATQFLQDQEGEASREARDHLRKATQLLHESPLFQNIIQQYPVLKGFNIGDASSNESAAIIHLGWRATEMTGGEAVDHWKRSQAAHPMQANELPTSQEASSDMTPNSMFSTSMDAQAYGPSLGASVDGSPNPSYYSRYLAAVYPPQSTPPGPPTFYQGASIQYGSPQAFSKTQPMSPSARRTFQSSTQKPPQPHVGPVLGRNTPRNRSRPSGAKPNSRKTNSADSRSYPSHPTDRQTGMNHSHKQTLADTLSPPAYSNDQFEGVKAATSPSRYQASQDHLDQSNTNPAPHLPIQTMHDGYWGDHSNLLSCTRAVEHEPIGRDAFEKQGGIDGQLVNDLNFLNQYYPGHYPYDQITTNTPETPAYSQDTNLDFQYSHNASRSAQDSSRSAHEPYGGVYTHVKMAGKGPDIQSTIPDGTTSQDWSFQW